MKTSNRQVAETILEQIRTTSLFALPSWSADMFIFSDNSLQFKIKTSRVKRGSMLLITLNEDDLYDIEVFRVYNLKRIVDQRAEDVYAEMLVETIDSMIGNCW